MVYGCTHNRPTETVNSVAARLQFSGSSVVRYISNLVVRR